MADGVLTALPATTPADDHGHGTTMAGLSLFGDLEVALGNNTHVRLRHRLKSVKVVDSRQTTKPDMYGAVMAEASAAIELDAPGRRRVFSLPVSTDDGPNDGRPSSWSAALHALSFGTAIAPSRTGIQLIDRPDPSAPRLFLAVVPVGGWWKGNAKSDRAELPIRYSLLISLTSKVPTDIYTPIANQIGIETPIEI